MYYTTKSNNVERDYVVIRHGIPNVNGMVMGVKFRNSWAVVEKDSKIYHRIRKLPMLKNPEERPLSFLRQLPFITRPMDVKLIYGADVYAKYVTLETKEKAAEQVIKEAEEEKLHLEDETKCKYRLESGKLCKNEVYHPDVTSYCSVHIFKDPRLEEMEFSIPKAMTPKDRKKLRKTAFNKLKNYKKTEESVDVSMVQEEASGAEEPITEST